MLRGQQGTILACALALAAALLLPAGAGAHRCTDTESLATGCKNIIAGPGAYVDPGGIETSRIVPPIGRYFGFSSNLTARAITSGALEAELAERAGANAFRLAAHWRYLQYCPDDPSLPDRGYGLGAIPPEMDQFGDTKLLRRLDSIFLALHSRGIRPIITTYDAPLWAAKPTMQTCDDPARSGVMHPAPTRMNQYSRFVGAVARRYPGAVIETWNEPNLQWHHPEWGIGPTPREMREIQCAAYQAVKSVDSTRRVLAPGFIWAENWEHFHQYVGGMLALGAHRCWDRFNVHLQYFGQTYFGPNSQLSRRMRHIRSTRARWGDFDRIWITETGYTTGGNNPWEPAVTPEAQSDASQRLHSRLGTMSDVEAIVFHTLRDRKDSESAEPGEMDPNFGFLTHEPLVGSSLPEAPGEEPFVPKPVYCAFVRNAGNTYPGCR